MWVERIKYYVFAQSLNLGAFYDILILMQSIFYRSLIYGIY